MSMIEQSPSRAGAQTADDRSPTSPRTAFAGADQSDAHLLALFARERAAWRAVDAAEIEVRRSYHQAKNSVAMDKEDPAYALALAAAERAAGVPECERLVGVANNQVREVWAEIARTPARSAAGVLAKLMLSIGEDDDLWNGVTSEAEGAALDNHITVSALCDLARLAQIDGVAVPAPRLALAARRALATIMETNGGVHLRAFAESGAAR